MSLGDRGAYGIGDLLRVDLFARSTLGDDHQLLGGVVRVELESAGGVLKDHLGQFVGRHGKRGHEAGPQSRAGFLRRELEVLRVVVAAVDDHQVLDSSGDVQLVLEPDAVVAGLHPLGALGSTDAPAALGQRRGEGVVERLLGLLRPTPVSVADVHPVQPDLTHMAVGTLGTGLGVDDHGPLTHRHLSTGHLCHCTRRILIDQLELSRVEGGAIDIDDLRLVLAFGRRHEERGLCHPV